MLRPAKKGLGPLSLVTQRKMLSHGVYGVRPGRARVNNRKQNDSDKNKGNTLPIHLHLVRTISEFTRHPSSLLMALHVSTQGDGPKPRPHTVSSLSFNKKNCSRFLDKDRIAPALLAEATAFLLFSGLAEMMSLSPAGALPGKCSFPEQGQNAFYVIISWMSTSTPRPLLLQRGAMGILERIPRRSQRMKISRLFSRLSTM